MNYKSQIGQDKYVLDNIFANKKNFKWYAIIGAGIIFWYIAERT